LLPVCILFVPCNPKALSHIGKLYSELEYNTTAPRLFILLQAFFYQYFALAYIAPRGWRLNMQRVFSHFFSALVP